MKAKLSQNKKCIYESNLFVYENTFKTLHRCILDLLQV